MRHEHTSQCQRQHTFFQVERARYTAHWPRYCRKCGGEGFTWYTYDPSPAGVSLSPGTMEDFEPCFDCLEQGICPRCGQMVWTDADWDGKPVVCSLCGWEEAKPDGLPPKGECLCWVEWERQELVGWARWNEAPLADRVFAPGSLMPWPVG